MTRRPRRRLRAALPAILISPLLGVVPSVVAPGLAVAAGPAVVSAVPSAATPNVDDGVVYAFAQVGSTMVVGGSFTTLSAPGTTTPTFSHPDVAAFDASTGAISSGFAPTINGEVDALLPGPAANEVYVGGQFTTVDGKSARVVLLNVSTGAIVSGWTSPAMNGPVSTLAFADNHLLVGGYFTTAGGADHKALVALNPTSGAVTPYTSLDFSGHHNYGTQCNPATSTCANGPVGIRSMSANSAGTELVMIGNFTHVSGANRVQIAVVDLSASAATLDTGWASAVYTAPCFAGDFDSNVRYVDFSPDGSFFAVTATGASNLSTVHDINTDGTYSPCDSVIRFSTTQHGADVKPVWQDRTGNDTLVGLAATNTAIYVGGHQRWLNNYQGHDDPHEGAVPRPGLAAADPVNGMPLAWNPGRNPRGVGCYVLYATSSGLWEGSDTNYIGNQKYLREKLAFFPYAGGSTPPVSSSTPSLPGRLFAAGSTAANATHPDRLVATHVTTTTSSDPVQVSSPVSWGSTRGAFYLDGNVYYGKAGWLYKRSFDGMTFGAATKVDPYDDPTWSSIQTGSGQVYRGKPSTLKTEMPKVTSLFFTAGRLYYTMSGNKHLFYRYFEPDDGAVGAQELTAPGTHNWSNVEGAVLADKTLFFGNRTTGQLDAIKWTGTQSKGVGVAVNPATNWASRGMFMLPGGGGAAPTAHLTQSCDGTTATCTFTASPSDIPATYHWAFGDGATTSGSKTTVTHRYTKDGSFTASLAVTDAGGGAAVDTATIAISTPIKTISAVAAASTKSTHRLVPALLPKKLASGDQLVLVASAPSRGGTPRLPAGWVSAGSIVNGGLRSSLFTRRVTSAAMSGTRETLRFVRRVPSEVAISAYAGVAANPIAQIASTVSSPAAPALRNLSAGQWALWAWTQSSHGATKWSAPRGTKWRVGAATVSAPSVAALIADSNGSVSGNRAARLARSSKPATATINWSIALTPAFG